MNGDVDEALGFNPGLWHSSKDYLKGVGSHDFVVLGAGPLDIGKGDWLGDGGQFQREQRYDGMSARRTDGGFQGYRALDAHDAVHARMQLASRRSVEAGQTGRQRGLFLLIREVFGMGVGARQLRVGVAVRGVIGHDVASAAHG